MTKLISWNVNGLRACVGKGFLEYFNSVDADIFCLQETKLQEGQIDLPLEGYYQYWNYAEKKGYSGVAMFTKSEPISVKYGIGRQEHDHEGRVIAAEFPNYWVVTCYTPNSQDGLARLPYRRTWNQAFLEFLKELEETKPVVFCGCLLYTSVLPPDISVRQRDENAGEKAEHCGKLTEAINKQFPGKEV